MGGDGLEGRDGIGEGMTGFGTHQMRGFGLAACSHILCVRHSVQTALRATRGKTVAGGCIAKGMQKKSQG